MSIGLGKATLWDLIWAQIWVAKGGDRVARGCRSWEPWEMRREEGIGCRVSSWQGTSVYKWDQEVWDSQCVIEGEGACDVFGRKKETGSGLQNQIGEGDLLLKEQRKWMKESECGKCRCGWGKNI